MKNQKIDKPGSHRARLAGAIAVVLLLGLVLSACGASETEAPTPTATALPPTEPPPPTALSGGEAQRLKLAKELGRRISGRGLYLLDEPTTGLHLADIARLLDVLQRLVEAGNSVIVVEHNLELIKAADWVIDLGPEGGLAGGRLMAEGTPEQVAQVAGSYTGEYLRERLGQ